MSSYIEVSGGTPKLTRHDGRLRASIEQALTPARRNRPIWNDDATFNAAQVEGDILDTAPNDDCFSWRWYWSKARGTVGRFFRCCGTRSCPRCAPGYLAERVGPAVKVWGKRALRVEYASPGAWKWERERAGLMMRGKNAEPGLVAIRHADGVVVWAPVQVHLDGIVLSGEERWEQLVADLRDVPAYDQPKPRGNGNANPAPVGAARNVERIERTAQEAGINLVGGKKRKWAEAPATEEQGRRFVESMHQKVDSTNHQKSG